MSMMDGDNLRRWPQRFRDTLRQGRNGQTQALLAAFAKIDDAVLRAQMVLMLEVVTSSPQVLAKLKTTALGRDSDEPVGNVTYLNLIG